MNKLVYCIALCLVSFSLSAQTTQPAPSGGGTQVVVRGRGVNILGSLELCKGGETVLKVDGEYESYQWNTGHTGRYLNVRKEGQYEVTVKTKSGCTFTASVTVRERPCS
jgi:hypothetical protein